MPTMDQVVWQNVNLTTGGEITTYARGALLPETVDSEEAAQRAMLRAGGALRVVEVVYTPEELADQARARGEATSLAEAQAGLDPTVPPDEQQVEPGPPVLPAGHGGSPVVIGDEEMRAEHQQQAEQAEQRRAASRRGAGGKFTKEGPAPDRASAEGQPPGDQSGDQPGAGDQPAAPLPPGQPRKP